MSLSYCPSCPIVPWTRWTVLWNPSISKICMSMVRHYPTAHPVHGQDGQHYGIQVSIQVYLILLSIPSYCWIDSTMNLTVYLHIRHYPTVHPVLLYMDRMDSTMESMSTQVYLILLSIPSYCTMDWMDSTMNFTVYLHIHTSLSYCPSRPWTRWTAL